MHQLKVVPIPGTGAEDVLVGLDGTVYTGTEDGAIHQAGADGHLRVVGNTGGRPLGLEWLTDGRLLICDADRGLVAMDLADGVVEDLLTTIDGVPMRFCNNAAVAADGTIWFSDSSRTYGIAEWKRDFLEQTRSGRLIRRDPDGTVTVMGDGFSFANGVALAADESWVVVAETAARTVRRLWLDGDKAGTWEPFATDLPGYPDNVARGSDGLIWVTIASPFDPLVDRLQRGPMALRKLATRIPEALQPKPKRTARVIAYDADGAVVHDIDADASGFHMATGVREADGRVWLGSLIEPAVAWLDL